MFSKSRINEPGPKAGAETEQPKASEPVSKPTFDYASSTPKPKPPASVLSSRRHTLSRPIDESHRALHDLGIPTLAIWGAEDGVIGKWAIGRLAELNPDAHHAQVAGAGHVLLQTHPANVTAALRRFLQDHPG